MNSPGPCILHLVGTAQRCSDRTNSTWRKLGMSVPWYFSHIAYATACPQPAEADIAATIGKLVAGHQ
jgi:hypothetical protein